MTNLEKIREIRTIKRADGTIKAFRKQFRAMVKVHGRTKARELAIEEYKDLL